MGFEFYLVFFLQMWPQINGETIRTALYALALSNLESGKIFDFEFHRWVHFQATSGYDFSRWSR